MRARPLHNLLILMLAAWLAVGAGGSARADALDGVLEVRSAYVGLANVPHVKLRGQGRAATRIAARWLLPCVLASAQKQIAANVTPSELCSAQAARPPGRSRAATASA